MATVTFDPNPAIQGLPCTICYHVTTPGDTVTLQLSNGLSGELRRTATLVVGPANDSGVACGTFTPGTEWDEIVVNGPSLTEDSVLVNPQDGTGGAG